MCWAKIRCKKNWWVIITQGIGWNLDLGNSCETPFLKYSSSIPQGLKECLRNGWGKGEEDFHISPDSSLIPQFLRNPFAFHKESVESSSKWLAFLEDSSGFLNSLDSLRKHGGVISTALRPPPTCFSHTLIVFHHSISAQSHHSETQRIFFCFEL